MLHGCNASLGGAGSSSGGVTFRDVPQAGSIKASDIRSRVLNIEIPCHYLRFFADALNGC
jgi:hypothetical protein